jgi:hypothetical protein
MVALTHFPKTRLSELAGRLGGISRDVAVAEARKQLEAMQHESDEVIEGSIHALEAIVYGPDRGDGYSEEQMRNILCLCDQIVTLAATFDYSVLDKVARSLCDVADGLLRTNRQDGASIHVHMQAMRMVSPRAQKLKPEEIATMMSQLSKILAHHGFDQLSAAANHVGIEDPAAAVLAERG